MADLDPEVAEEVARLKKINRELSRLRLEGLLAGARERRRIFESFDGGIVQRLVCLQLRLDALLKHRRPPGDLSALRELVGEAIEEAHLLADAMAPNVLFKVGLRAALRDLFERYARESGCHYCLDTENAALDAVEETTGLVLYDLVERLLEGAVRGCRADIVAAQIRTSGARIEAVVEDNGAGLDVQEIIATGRVTEKPFLVAVAEEVRFLGGEVWIGRSPGTRTVCLVIPQKITALP